jgi:beta-xylosidase
MIEAVMFWNEPNNKSHWDFSLDPEWRVYADMVKLASAAVAAENPRLARVLGGISPIDGAFMRNMQAQGVLDGLDAVAVHGFPLDWNHWNIHDWPAKLDEIRAVTDLPIWVSEVGVSSFGAEEVQEWGLQRTADLLIGRAPRIHWYSLYDLPRAWPATTRHREAEGSAYYRHFYMGLLHEDGTPKLALKHFGRYTPEFGICQWFHFEDHRLDQALRWLRTLKVRYLRTGLSWSDSLRPNAIEWFDRQMRALEEFDVTLTLCFTPESRGVQPHHTSPPQRTEEFADFCAGIVRRYSPATTTVVDVEPKTKSQEEGYLWPAEVKAKLPPTTTRSADGSKNAVDGSRW